MIKISKENIKKFFSSLLHNILAGYVLAIVGLPLLISWVTGTLDFLFQIANMPMPLWATIAMIVLCCLYTYLKIVQNPSNQSSKTPPHKTMSSTIDDLKWNTKIYNDGHFEVDRISICLEHDLTLIRANTDYYCPEYIKKNCNILIDHIEYDLLYATAKSYIDKEIRNKKY